MARHATVGFNYIQPLALALDKFSDAIAVLEGVLKSSPGFDPARYELADTQRMLALEAVLKGDTTSEQALSEDERLVLAFTEQSTKNVKIEDSLFAKVKATFSDQEVMELTIAVAGYNMVSRFLVALDVTESNGKTIMMPQ